MKFSIVIPSYSGERFIENAILSALNQTRPADEIIVSDDNSTDNTIKICSKYSDKVKIYKNPTGPSGFVNGWNNAISYATGDFISILHQDDILDSKFLEEIEKAINICPDVKHFFTPCYYIDINGNIIETPKYCTGEIKRYSGREYVAAYQNIGKPHIHRCPGVVTHRDIFKVCKYNPNAGHIADDDFFYRIGQFTDVVGILKPYASYRIHKFSETGHLKNAELVSRLAHDYIYQLHQWHGNDFLTKKEFKYFIHWAIYYTQQEILFGKKHNDVSIIDDSKKHLSDLKALNITVKNMSYYLKYFKLLINNLLQR